MPRGHTGEVDIQLYPHSTPSLLWGALSAPPPVKRTEIDCTRGSNPIPSVVKMPLSKFRPNYNFPFLSCYYVCTVPLPPGGNPNAIDKYIKNCKQYPELVTTSCGQTLCYSTWYVYLPLCFTCLNVSKLRNVAKRPVCQQWNLMSL